MKKLMITLSAAAMAFGLFADTDPVTLPVGENFNGGSVPATISNPGDSTISTAPYGDAFSKYSTVGAPAQFYGVVDPEDNLAVKTPFNAPASFAIGEAKTMAGLYFDSMVKFTACDEEPDMSNYEGAKLVVWTKEVENGDSVSQRLMVTAGFLNDTENTPIAKSYDCGTPADYGIVSDADWCRLTIKAIKDISVNLGVPGFVVFVNGTAVEISTDKAIGVDGSAKDSLTKVNAIWAKNNHLFPSLVAAENTISEVAFAGQGNVDDISFTTVEPENVAGEKFALDPVPAIATVNGKEATTLAAINNTLASGAGEVVLLDNIEGDIVFAVAGNNSLNLNGFTLNGGIDASTDAGVAVTVTGTGSVEGTLTPNGRNKNFMLEGGQFKSSANAQLDKKANVKAGYELKDNGTYWEVVEISEDGSVDKPWKISTADDFQKITTHGIGAAGKDQHFKLEANIDLDGAVFQGFGARDAKDLVSWSITGDKAIPLDTAIENVNAYTNGAFTGIFEGNGKTISGLVLKRGDYPGLFMSCYGATIKNLKVQISGTGFSDSDTGDKGGAAIVGVAVDTTIENCETLNPEGALTFTGTKGMAGIVGYASSGTVLKGCVNNLNISTTNDKGAGLIGCAQYGGSYEGWNGFNKTPVVVDGCTNVGNVTGGKFTGGFVAYTDCPVTFEGANVFEGTLNGTSPSVIYLNNGSVAVDADASFTVPADRVTVNKNAVDGLFFATVKDSVATLVKTADVVAGGSYKVMAAGAAKTNTLEKGQTIAFDKALVTGFAPTVNAAEGCKITTSTTGTVTTYTCAELVKATAPTAKTGLIYNGEPQTGVEAGEGYTLEGNTATAAGNYTATATLAEGYDQWSDGTTEAKSIPWSIAKATPTITTAPTASAEIEKDAALNTITLVGGEGSVAGTFAWTTPTTTVDADGEFSVTFTPEDTTNYDTATCMVAVKVKTGGGEYPSDWPETDPETKAKYVSWAAEKGKGADPELPATQEAFLMNCSPAELEAEKAAFKITAFDGTKASIVTPTANTKGDAFNGTIVMKAYSDAACTTEVTEPTGEEVGLFYRAVLTFPVAED